ncbi:MAG: hypothetical protein ACRC6X_05060 [Culicoidibacterales bacterium]
MYIINRLVKSKILNLFLLIILAFMLSQTYVFGEFIQFYRKYSILEQKQLGSNDIQIRFEKMANQDKTNLIDTELKEQKISYTTSKQLLQPEYQQQNISIITGSYNFDDDRESIIIGGRNVKSTRPDLTKLTGWPSFTVLERNQLHPLAPISPTLAMKDYIEQYISIEEEVLLEKGKGVLVEIEAEPTQYNLFLTTQQYWQIMPLLVKNNYSVLNVTTQKQEYSQYIQMQLFGQLGQFFFINFLGGICVYFISRQKSLTTLKEDAIFMCLGATNKVIERSKFSEVGILCLLGVQLAFVFLWVFAPPIIFDGVIELKPEIIRFLLYALIYWLGLCLMVKCLRLQKNDEIGKQIRK